MKDDEMQPHKHVIAIAALMVFVAVPAVAQDEKMNRTVLTAQVSSRSTSAPLDMRVSVQFVNGKPVEILQVLAKAAGLALEAPAAPLQPVTLTVTNVRLRTALDAICDNAACTWRLEGTTIKVAAAGGTNSDTSGGTLPPIVSIALEEVAVPDVFRAIGAAIGIEVVIEGQPQRPPLTVKFTNSQTPGVLDFLCKNAGCVWEFDGPTRQLRVRFKAP